MKFRPLRVFFYLLLTISLIASFYGEGNFLTSVKQEQYSEAETVDCTNNSDLPYSYLKHRIRNYLFNHYMEEEDYEGLSWGRIVPYRKGIYEIFHTYRQKTPEDVYVLRRTTFFLDKNFEIIQSVHNKNKNNPSADLLRKSNPLLNSVFFLRFF